jgi:hypothetical protein
MPRPNRRRDVFAEEHLASNVETLRLARGWTYDGLARRMSDIGCPIDQSAIYKIEKVRPRRRITVDELVGFSRIFGRSLEQMIADPALHASEDAIAAADELFRAVGNHLLVNEEQERERQSLTDRLVRATEMSPEAREAVVTYVGTGTGKRFALGDLLGEQLRSQPVASLAERQRVPNDRLAEVARVYRENKASGRPTKAVGEFFGYPASTASLYVKRARKAGHDMGDPAR